MSASAPKNGSMTRFQRRTLSVCLAAAASYVTLPVLAQQKPGDLRDVEEVIVTAQKRSQNLQDVPISISVLSGDDLDKSSIMGVREALNRVPGVVTTAANQGGGTQLAVRGVGASGPLFNGSSPIAYYIDSVPFGLVKTAIAPDSNAYDLQRIEVLRGPQGTLYGANAQNGVVRVLTRDANLDEFEFKTRATLSTTDGGGGNYRGDMAVNVPIVDGKLGLRAVAGYEDLSGWINNLVDDDVNDAELRNFRLKLNAQPTDELSIGLSAWRSRNDFGAPSAAPESGRRSVVLSEPVSADFDASGLKVDYDFSAFSVSSMTSYLEYKNRGWLALPPPPGPVDRPFFTSLDSEVFSQEVLINSKELGAWRWSLGAFYRDAEDELVQIIGLPATFAVNWGDSSESYAFFGEVSRRFLDDRLEWTVGLRSFHDDVVSRQIARDLGQVNPNLYRRADSFDSTTPRTVLTWFPNSDLTVYASYSEGFRSGFPQYSQVAVQYPNFPPVKPDELINYELGAKGDLVGGYISFDTAVYYIEWRDVQQTLNVPVGGGAFITAPVNGESASGIGVDFALTVRPVEGLDVSANVSLNDLSLDAPVFTSTAAGPVLLFQNNDRLNYSSKYTGGLAVDYSFPVFATGLKGRLSTSGNYSSKQTNHALLGTTATVIEGDDLLVARASLSVLASDDRWTAMLFVDNATNEDGATPAIAPTRLEWTPRLRPRTVGLQLDYNF